MMLTAGEQSRMLLVRPDVALRVYRTMDRAEAATGVKLYVIRGWVPYSNQARVYADSLKQGFQAVPANVSRHPLGAAVDVGFVGHVHDDAATDQADPLYRTLAQIAAEEGLAAGYNWTNTKPDPYHLEAKETLQQSRDQWSALVRGRLWRIAGAAVAVSLVAVAVSGHRRLRQ